MIATQPAPARLGLGSMRKFTPGRCEICAMPKPLYFHTALIAALCTSCTDRPAAWFVDFRTTETAAARRRRDDRTWRRRHHLVRALTMAVTA